MSTEPTVTLSGRVFGPALVLSTTNDRRCQVILEHGDCKQAVAQIPVSLAYEGRPGDRLLVAGEPGELLYVLSVLESTEPVKTEPGFGETQVLTSRNGAFATLTEDCEVIRVSDAGGTLLFEYDSATATAKLSAPVHLELEATRRLAFKSSGTISFQSPDFSLQTERAELAIDDFTYEGHAVRAKLQRVRLAISRLETVARTVISRAVNVFAKVDELSQLRAGKRRVLTEKEYYLRCEKAALRSRKDFKIDGEKIELG